MPELPEAETIARGLRARVLGRRIAAIRFLSKRVATRATRATVSKRVLGRAITDVRRRAKLVLLRLDSSLLAVDLRMTGRLVWVPPAETAEDLEHVRAIIELDDGSQMVFDDIRQFGSITFFTSAQWARHSARFGPEPLEADFTPQFLEACLQRKKAASVKTALLDPRCAAGVGNVYANEACFEAGIRPGRRARKLRGEEIERLHKAIRAVLSRAIEARGTTFRDYRDAAGNSGSYQDFLLVYGREGEPCIRCGARLRRTVIGGRSAFLCPQCQR